MEEIQADPFVVSYVVKSIIHRNSNDGFTIVSLKDIKTEDKAEFPSSSLIGKGVFDKIKEGDSFKSVATWDATKQYGLQLKLNVSFPIAPSNIRGIKRFLKRFISGVGTKTADDIVNLYGLTSIDKLKEDISYVLAVPGIGQKKAKKIHEQILSHSGMEDLSLYLFSYGITNYMTIVNIYEALGENSLSILKGNPYALCDTLSYSYFSVADTIAKSSGFLFNDSNRINSAIYCCLRQEMSYHNDVCMTYLNLKKRFPIWLSKHGVFDVDLVDGKTFVESLKFLSDTKKIALCKSPDGESVVYPGSLYCCETKCVDSLLRLLSENDNNVMSQENAECFLADYEATIHTQLDPLQKKAVFHANQYMVSIITGGPGTGKTITIDVLLNFFDSVNLKVGLAAPTGRAAKRMAEVCKREALTIHRLLELNQSFHSTSVEELELDYDVLIIDEFSMVDIVLASSLLEAAEYYNIRIVIVGDAHQLPSVGPGLILRDIINSRVVPTVELVTLFRQAAESQIALNAHKIIKGVHCGVNDGLSFDPSKQDFFFFKATDAISFQNLLIRSLKSLLSTGVSAEDITVLSPVRKGFAGTEYLNDKIRGLLNPPSGEKCEITYFTHSFREGDRVMQICNNYEKERGASLGVFNGEVGVISRIDPITEELFVEYQDMEYHDANCEHLTLVKYEKKELNQLELAYAVTVHKSQGCEFPIVFMPALYFPNYNRNLLYTAVTRAKKMVTLIGNEESLNRAISSVDESERFSLLKQRLINGNRPLLSIEAQK